MMNTTARTRPATLVEIRAKILGALALLEEARRMMVYPDNSAVDHEDVHALAMAQYEVSVAADRLTAEARTEMRRRSKR
jgi:hypothetical protein